MNDSSYASTKNDNEFLKALADGGFQVGELAKVYHPKGVDVDTLDRGSALARTAELLKQDKVTIFEAAISFGPYLIRVDILEKIGNSFRLSEVKSSTFDSEKIKEFGFFTKSRKTIASEWEPYLIDVAFQTHVLKEAFPDCNISSNIVLVDKDVASTADGLNQMFVILPVGKDGKKIRVANGVNAKSVGEKILRSICVDDEVKFLWKQSYGEHRDFKGYAAWLASVYQESKFVKSPVSNDCRSCEYRIPKNEIKDDKKSGFDYCLSTILNISNSNLKKEFVFDIRNFWRKVPDLLAAKKYFMSSLSDDDVDPKPRDDSRGWSQSERQLLQISAAKNISQNVWVLSEQLASELKEWTFPLHFIDFETCRVAIPFHKGRKPYEQIAFQFSHHTVSESGDISHESQFLDVEKGKFPNFNFVRALKKALSKDNGTIFRYHNHENTVLNEIRSQILLEKPPLPDAKELVEFIDSITYRKGPKGEKILGSRAMVDLCEVVERFYFHRSMGGRTSIKKVLPAILQDSTFLRSKYSKAIKDLGISSLAHGSLTLIKFDSLGNVLDPYESLPPVFTDMEVPDNVHVDGEIRGGGAAMTAYARLQFSEVNGELAEHIKSALLRYCELDTFAMVLIWEYWKDDLIKRKVA